MHRVLVWSAVVLLATQVALAAGTSRKVTVSGQLSGGTKVSVTCTVSSTGGVSGGGTLSGTGGSYPFTVTKFTTDTAKGLITFTGHFTGATYPLTLTAKFPNGAQTFSYVVNGKTVTLNGQGTVTIQ